MNASKRELARVFFEYDDDNLPIRLIGLSLENHVTHVTDLVRQWDSTRAYGGDLGRRLQQTHARVIRAAQRHDEGKPQTFKLEKQYNGKAHRAEISYSFRGHRFLVVDDDPYVDWLIRLHHEYDVATITEAQTDLRRRYPGDTGKSLAVCFPYDLYTLEMCDQIDAEASSYALANDPNNPDRERAFMEYHSHWQPEGDTQGTLCLDPWPFEGDSVPLDYPSFVIEATPDCRKEFKDASLKSVLPLWQRLATEGLPITCRDTRKLILRPEKGAERGEDVEAAPTRQFFGGICPFPANPMQDALSAELGQSDGDGFLLLKAPTGSGKTEAVVAPALEARRRLFLILPSRSLVEDQQQRLSLYLLEVSKKDWHGRRASLIVDTGERSERTVWVNGEQRPKAGSSRHLYDADVIVTTLDSFMFRFFAFGAGNKSYIFPLRVQLQRSERPPLFCFDEAHCYDTLAWQNFLALVEALACDMGSDVVIMSATMSKKAEEQVARLGAQVLDFATGEGLRQLRDFQQANGGRPHPATRLHYEPCADSDVVPRLTDLALGAWRPGRRVIVCAERVSSAVEIHAALRERVPTDALVLYHGRLDAWDRRKRYELLSERDKAADGRGYLLVTTSAIEVGCDLDAHALITQFCYPEQLVQRAGRCNRRALHSDAALHVVGSHLESYTSSLPKNAREQLESAMIATLNEQNGKPLKAEAFVELNQLDLTRDDRADVLFSLLYEYVYQADRTAKPAHDKGLVLTRSWEPSVTLMEVDANGRTGHEVQVPLSRCLVRSGEQPDPRVRLRREIYNDADRRMEREEIRYGGCCYLHRLVAELPAGYYDPVCGYAQVPRFLRRAGSARGYRQSVAYVEEGRDIYLWYLRELPSDAAADEPSEAAVVDAGEGDEAEVAVEV